MKRLSATDNYMDHDVAYLLGMVVGRGSMTETGNDRRLVIDFPYRALHAKGVSQSFDQPTHLELAVYNIRNRIEQLVEAEFDTNITRSKCQFIMRFGRKNTSWRNLRVITEGQTSYRASVVPQRILGAPEDIQKEFMRGLADVCGFVRASNHFHGAHRVYIQIPAQNWRLPVSLCRLLQVHLGVPVQLIQWNHPNTRIPNQTEKKLTSREHQLKIFAHAFVSVGFYVDYKQRILEELAELNKDCRPPVFCNPNPRAHQRKQKPKHPEENSQLVPDNIRGMHFDGYYQICSEMGCEQFKPIAPGQDLLLDNDKESGDAE